MSALQATEKFCRASAKLKMKRLADKSDALFIKKHENEFKPK